MMPATTHGNLEAAAIFDAFGNPGTPPEEIVAAMEWLGHSEMNRPAFQRIARFMDCCDAIGAVITQEEIREEIRGTRASHGTPFHRWITFILDHPRVAACITFLALGLSALLLSVYSPFQRESGGLQAMRYATATGEIRTVKLPDGSTMELSGASAVSLRFSGAARDIQLTDGEAFFQVAHDARRPFVVTAGSGSIRAVGTQFNVQCTPDGINVAVAEGRIAVTSGENSVGLVAGSQVSYAHDGSISEISPIAPGRIASWRSGVLSFRAQPLSRVVADLNRYSIRPIIIESFELAAEPITGKVQIDRIEEWLSGLAATGDIEIRASPSNAILLKSGHRRRITSATP